MKRFVEKKRLVVAIVAGLIVTPGTVAEAAPVTFRFEAEITHVYLGAPFDSGIDFSIGDSIAGQFSFAPSAGDGGMSFDVIQSFPAYLEIDGAVFKTPPSRSDFVVRSVNNTTISDFPFSGNVDTLLTGGSLFPIESAIFASISPENSSFRISLVGIGTILNQASHPNDSSTWNAFSFRRTIDVSIRGKEGGVISFQASVGMFHKIPEPFSLSMLFSSLLVIFSTRRNQ